MILYVPGERWPEFWKHLSVGKRVRVKVVVKVEGGREVRGVVEGAVSHEWDNAKDKAATANPFHLEIPVVSKCLPVALADGSIVQIPGEDVKGLEYDG